MEYNKRYTISEMRAILGESTQEFKPVLGDGVEAANGRNNEKAVGDIMDDTARLEADAAKDGSKGRSEPPRNADDFNKTTLGYEYRTEPSDSYKERVEAQVHGYTSKQNEENSDIADENKALGFEGNKEFYDAQKEKQEKVQDAETDLRHSGLAARTFPEETFKKETLFKESRKMKRLHYKNTKFISEGQLRKLIPEEYKKDGNRFLMRDMDGEEYMVECKAEPNIGFLDVKVEKHLTESQVNESLEHLRHLFGYDSKEASGRDVKDKMDMRESLDRMAAIAAATK